MSTRNENYDSIATTTTTTITISTINNNNDSIAKTTIGFPRYL